MRVGVVKDIYRYPVKSMGGERLMEAPIKDNGIVGDRSFAFKMAGKYLTAIEMPELFAHQAGFKSDGDDFGTTVKTPDGQEFDWNDQSFINYMADKTSDRNLEQVESHPEDRGAYWEDHLLIISESSLKKVADLCNEEELNMKRFRPNVVIELDSGVPFEEEQWMGKKLVINDITLTINSHCPRCAYVNIDPNDPTKITPKILKTIVKERGGNLGVYASVVNHGTLKAGAEIFLID